MGHYVLHLFTNDQYVTYAVGLFAFPCLVMYPPAIWDSEMVGGRCFPMCLWTSSECPSGLGMHPVMLEFP